MTSLTFTPLETALISVVGAIVVGIFIRVRCVSEAHCNNQHNKVNGDIKMIFNMLRAIVINMKDMPEEEKVKILNDNGGK